MKKKMFMTAIMLTLLITMNACCTIAPGKVVYSDSLQGTINELREKGVDISAAILITSDGRPLIYDKNGNGPGTSENIKECRLPELENQTAQTSAVKSRTKEKKDKTTPPGVCRGMTKGSAITSIQTISILKSNSEECLTFGTDADGNPIEVCYEVP